MASEHERAGQVVRGFDAFGDHFGAGLFRVRAHRTGQGDGGQVLDGAQQPQVELDHLRAQ